MARLVRAALCAVACASASGCGGVRFVRINNVAGAAPMNFVEVQVWTPWGVNAALSQVVTVNSTLASYPGTKAVDGIALQDSTESFYNSAGSGTNEFWQVDLGAEYIIQNITFFNRFFNACCRFRAATGQYLFAMNATRGTVGPVFNLTAAAVQTYNYTGACAVTPTPSALPSPGGCGARYLRVAMVYPGVDLINFDELEAWTADGRNVALRAPATSFSCYSGSCTTYGPACVTDGLRGDKPCFFNSAGTSASEWVEVDLRASYILSRVIFYNRQSCCWNRANNTQLRVLDSNRVQLAAFNLTTATAPQSFNMPWAFCPTQTASGSASLSASGSRSASRSASPSVSAVATGSRTGTGTTTGTATGTATRSLTPGASASTTALGTGTATVTASTTATTSVTATLTGTETGSLTSSATATATLVTASPTTTATATLTRGVSASLSAAATATLSPGAAASISSTTTSSSTATSSTTNTGSSTASSTATLSLGASASVTASNSPSSSFLTTPSVTATASLSRGALPSESSTRSASTLPSSAPTAAASATPSVGSVPASSTSATQSPAAGNSSGVDGAAQAADSASAIAPIAGGAAAGLLLIGAVAAGLVVRRRRQQSQRRRPAQAKAAAAATAANPLLAEGALSGEENPLAAASGAAAASFRATHAPILVRTPSVASVAGGSARVEALAAAETNLAPGWTAKWSNSRSICYWVSADGTSVWEKPVAKLGDTLVLTDLSLIRNEDVKKAVSLRRAVSGRAVTDEAPAPAPPPAPSADDPGDAAVGLAPGWAPVWSRSREQWYWRDASGNSTWEKPTKLPSGWVEQYSKTRERPYWRHVDGRTVWERPSA